MLSSEILSNDIFKEIMSFTGPRDLLVIADTNDEIKALTKDPIMLKKLADDHHLPYYDGIDLEKLCEYSEMDKLELISVAAKLGDEKLFMYLSDYINESEIKNNRTSCTTNEVLLCSIEGGNINIFKYVLESYKLDTILYLSMGLVHIAKKIYEFRNDEMFKIVVDKYNIKLSVFNDMIMIDKVSFIRIILDSGKSDYYDMIKFFSSSNFNYVDLILDEYSHLWKPCQNINIYNCIFVGASAVGDMKIIQKMLDLGANNYSEAFISAASNNNVKIMKLILTFENMTINTLNTALTRSMFSNNIASAEFILDLGTYDLNDFLLMSLETNNIDMVRLIIGRGSR